MAKRFYRIGPAIWLEPWDDDTRMVALYLLTSPHRNTEGLFRMPLEYGRTDLGWPPRRFDAAFGKLVATGFVEHDADAQVVLLVNALKWQAPANPNQVTAAVRAISELPPTPLLNRLRTLAATHSKPLAEALAKRFPEPLQQPVANTPSLSPTTTAPPDPPRGELPPVPEKPLGNRRTDQARFEEQVQAYAAAAFPSLPDPNRWQLVKSAIGRDLCSHRAIADYVRHWAEGATA